MIKKNYKGRCVKKSVGKSKEVCRTYNTLQLAYLDKLQADKNITEIQCNIPLDGEIGEYNTDFLCVKTDGEMNHIPVAVKAAEVSSKGKSIYAYEPHSPVAKAYADFTKEVLADGRKKERLHSVNEISR